MRRYCSPPMAGWRPTAGPAHSIRPERLAASARSCQLESWAGPTSSVHPAALAGWPEETGLAVPFGLGFMVLPAERPDIGKRRLALVSHRVYMVVLEPEAPPAVRALRSCKGRHRAKVQSAAQLCAQVTPEVLDAVDRNTVVQDSLQEGVPAEFSGELYWYRAASYDLAHLAGVGMAPAPGEQVTDDDEVSSLRTRRALPDGHRRQGICRVGLEAFQRPTGLLHGAPRALCGKLEAVDKRHSGLWGKSTCKADHAELVAPVAPLPRAQLPLVQLVDIGPGLALLARGLAQLAEV